MSASNSFRNQTIKAFLSRGFKRSKDIYVTTNSLAILSANIQTVHNARCYINIGFNFTELTSEVPEKVEHSNCYYRLERIFPEHRELILSAGDYEEVNLHVINTFALVLSEKLLPELTGMTSNVVALRKACKEERLSQGLTLLCHFVEIKPVHFSTLAIVPP